MSLKRIKAEEKWIWALLFLSIIVICCTDFWFDMKPAFANWFYKLGRTFNNLSLAYISSVIFYWIVVSIPEKRKKRDIYDNIYRVTGNVIGDCEGLIHDLIKASGVTPSDLKNITREDFELILQKIHPYADAPLINQHLGNEELVYAKWFEYLNYKRNRSINAINNKLLNYIIYLETDYVKIITKVRDCSYFSLVQSMNNIQMSNTDMTFLSHALFDYYSQLKALKKYADLNLSEFSKNYSLNDLRAF
jgi:hypothetical protein